MKINIRRGFILLEILPALMLLLGSLLISGRILAHSSQTRIYGRMVSDLHDALGPVWHAWREQGGAAAFASREEGGSWTINTFPNISWLPVDAGAINRGQIVFSRERLADPPGWEIRRLVGEGESVRWIRVTRVLELNEGPPG